MLTLSVRRLFARQSSLQLATSSRAAYHVTSHHYMPAGTSTDGKSQVIDQVESRNRFGQPNQGDRGETSPTGDQSAKDKLSGKGRAQSEGEQQDSAPGKKDSSKQGKQQPSPKK